MLRDAPLDLGGDVAEQRVIFQEMMAAIPVPADVTTSSASLGGIPVINVDVAGADPERVILYFHGGAYAIGSRRIIRRPRVRPRAPRRARLVTVDYRLAPEHPFPAALEDASHRLPGTARQRRAPVPIAFAGESAGGGLAIATLWLSRTPGCRSPQRRC